MKLAGIITKLDGSSGINAAVKSFISLTLWSEVSCGRNYAHNKFCKTEH